jgi:hypothetical protein
MIDNRVKIQVSEEQFRVRVRRKTTKKSDSERILETWTTKVATIIV